MNYSQKQSKLNPPSEGELYIMDYLDDMGIKYIREVELNNLREDTAKFRRADFYLPKYNVYLEFQGRWNNSKEDRERYSKKKVVFYKNNIPCIYIYPENLGILEFSFIKRMVFLLKEHNMTNQLRRFRWLMFIEEEGGTNVSMLICSVILIIFNYNGDSSWLNIGILLFAYHVYQIQSKFRKVVY
jgi:hypothetical protein